MLSEPRLVQLIQCGRPLSLTKHPSVGIYYEHSASVFPSTLRVLRLASASAILLVFSLRFPRPCHTTHSIRRPPLLKPHAVPTSPPYKSSRLSGGPSSRACTFAFSPDVTLRLSCMIGSPTPVSSGGCNRANSVDFAEWLSTHHRFSIACPFLQEGTGLSH